VTVTQEALYSYWTAPPNEKMALETSHDPTIWPGHNNKAIICSHPGLWSGDLLNIRGM
jgi:hypothetical protein